MIEDALVFALGALFAGLVALVLFPPFMRRAARLARRDFEARLPHTAAEFAAAKDAVRAEYAARTARVEAERDAVQAALAAERLALAAERRDRLGAEGERGALGDALAEAERRTTAARAELREREEALARAAAEQRELERRLQHEAELRRAAEQRADELAAVAGEMRLALVAADARADPAAARPAAPARTAPRSDPIDAEWTEARAPSPAAAMFDVGPSLGDAAAAVPEVRPPTAEDAMAFGLDTAPAERAGEPAPAGEAGSPYEDPVQRARLVEALSDRLRRLRTENAAARGRGASAEPAARPEAEGGRDLVVAGSGAADPPP